MLVNPVPGLFDDLDSLLDHMNLMLSMNTDAINEAYFAFMPCRFEQ